MEMTVQAGATPVAAAGIVTLRFRLQYTFTAQDMTFTGSPPGTKILSVIFGDRIALDTPDGIEIENIAVTGALRFFLAGQTVDGGLDILVRADVPGPGTLRAVIVGCKS